MEQSLGQKLPIGRLEKAVSPSDEAGKQCTEQAYVKRPRRSKPKVKTGCITCKIRRVKCDEKKPRCEKCTSTGRTCDGYIRFYEDPNSTYGKCAVAEPRSSAMVVIPNPVFDTRGSVEERRCFDFFLNRTASQLSGFWDSDFWDCSILRATHHQPAIRHAVLALGSLHERFEAGDRSVMNPIWNKGEGGFALKQYNQAIQQLIKPASEGQQAVDVCLIACMLFVCFETLRGHHGSALSHVNSGVKILSEVEFNNNGEQHHGVLTASPHPFVNLQELEILFNRLDAQAAQMVGTRPMLLQKRPRDMEKGFCPEIPAAFTSLEQARNSSDYHWNGCIEFLNELQNNNGYPKSRGIRGQEPLDALRTTEAARQEYFDVFGRWLVAFQGYLQNHEKSLDSRGLQAARTLEISHNFAMIYLNVSTVGVFNDETAWDMFTEHYERVVNLAALIIESSTCNGFAKKRGPDFTLDMNIVAPLYAVAHKCRHPIIRRKAISLLYAAPRQEGIWDSILTARVAERLIGIEEAGLGNVTCSEDVPDWARISDVEVKFDPQGRLGTVKYSRQRSPLEKVRDTVIECVRW